MLKTEISYYAAYILAIGFEPAGGTASDKAGSKFDWILHK